MELLVVVLVVAALALGATRNLPAAGIVTFAFSFAALLVHALSGGSLVCLYGALGSAALLTGSLVAAGLTGVFRPAGGNEVKFWRVAARPFALLFIPIHVRWGNRFLLILIGVVSAVFIVSDIVRIFSNLHPEQLYKKGERKRFSSMTAFLVSIFVVFLLFPAPISYLSLAFATMGDLAGKLIGIRFGRTKLMERRTLEGSLGFAAGCLAASYVLSLAVPCPPAYVAIGTVAATAIELFSKDVDDNLTVGLLSGVILSVTRFFFRI